MESRATKGRRVRQLCGTVPPSALAVASSSRRAAPAHRAGGRAGAHCESRAVKLTEWGPKKKDQQHDRRGPPPRQCCRPEEAPKALTDERWG